MARGIQAVVRAVSAPPSVETQKFRFPSRRADPTFNERTGKPFAKGYSYEINKAVEKHGWKGKPGYHLYGLKRADGDAILNGDFGEKLPIELVSYLMDHADILRLM